MSDRPQVQFSNGPTSFRNRLKRLTAITCSCRPVSASLKCDLIAGWLGSGSGAISWQDTGPPGSALRENRRPLPGRSESFESPGAIRARGQRRDRFHITDDHRPDRALSFATLLVVAA